MERLWQIIAWACCSIAAYFLIRANWQRDGKWPTEARMFLAPLCIFGPFSLVAAMVPFFVRFVLDNDWQGGSKGI